MDHKEKPLDQVEAAFALALRIANSFRKRIGEDPIDGLLGGVPEEVHDCVLARTFNAGGVVSYSGVQHEVRDEGGYLDPGPDFYGYVEFGSKETAQAFCDAVVECDPDTDELAISDRGKEKEWKVDLPTAVAQIAFDFDHRQLVRDLYLTYGELEEIEEGNVTEQAFKLPASITT